MDTAWRDAEWQAPGIADRVAPAAGDVDESLRLAPALRDAAAALGGDTWVYLSALATLGALDLTTARALEPHLDAMTVLDQAGQPDLSPLGVGPDSRWGVFAAHHPAHRLSAERGPQGWRLTGAKAWCSLADRLTHALVTTDVTLDASTPDATRADATRADATRADATRPEHPGPEHDQRRLFAVSLDPAHTQADTAGWVPRGLRAVATATVRFDGAAAVPVGDEGWYLRRPGFAWGGIAVAAVWFGGAAAIAQQLLDSARTRKPDQVALAAIGRADTLLHGCLLALRDAARRIDDGDASGRAGEVLAARVRAIVAAGAEDVMHIVGHALGAAPLAHNERHAARVADLTLYVRQHHAERDLARLGSHVVALAGR